MSKIDGGKEWLNIWPSFADMAICAMVIFLVYTLYLSHIMPKDIPEKPIEIDVLDENIAAFITGDATLPQGSEAFLKGVLQKIQSKDEWQDESWLIVVKGHTDNVPLKGNKGGLENNWDLSAARANRVLEFFMEEGIPGNRLRAIGYGEHCPIADNKTKAGRQRNRRIEICLIKSNDNI